MKKWLFVIFLLIATIVSSLFAFKTNNAPAYYLAILCFGSFCLVYVVVVLNYNVGGKHISLEERINVLAEEHRELKEIANSLFKIIFISQDGASRWGGTPDEHLDLVSKYSKSISKYLEPNIMDNLKKDIEHLEELITERNKEKT